jgi:hypothetical protein
MAADDSAVGVISASVNHIAGNTESTLASRFTVPPVPVLRMLARQMWAWAYSS